MARKIGIKWSPFYVIDNLYGFFLGFWYTVLLLALKWAENGNQTVLCLTEQLWIHLLISVQREHVTERVHLSVRHV
jgi:hypothetical protein